MGTEELGYRQDRLSERLNWNFQNCSSQEQSHSNAFCSEDINLMKSCVFSIEVDHTTEVLV